MAWESCLEVESPSRHQQQQQPTFGEAACLRRLRAHQSRLARAATLPARSSVRRACFANSRASSVYDGSTSQEAISPSPPGTPSFLFTEADRHIYNHMTMAEFSLGDDIDEEHSRSDEPEEIEHVTRLKRAVTREAYELFLTVFHHVAASSYSPLPSPSAGDGTAAAGNSPILITTGMTSPRTAASSTSPLRAAIAPGRVNLIGEHVDFCDGFVLPMAIPLYTVAMGRLAEEQSRGYTTVFSSFYNETVRIYAPYEDNKEKYPQWARYIQGILAVFVETIARTRQQENGLAKSPTSSTATPNLCFDMLVHSHIQPGSSLSSSAALELATLYMLQQFAPEECRLSTRDAALLCQHAERRFASATHSSGVMDQLVIAAAKNQRALKIDCLSLEYEAIPMSIAHDVLFVVTNSDVKHAHASTEYAKRRDDVQRAAKLIGASSWRDVSKEILHQRSSSLTGEGGAMLERATHVVEEIARTVEAANALLDNNILLFGKLMTASHDSLKRQYGVSCPELDELVNIALSVEGVFGARMTGGGFGGCTVTMVRKDAVELLKKEITERYTGGHATFVECEPVGGARPISLDFLFPRLHLSPRQ